MKTVCIYHLVDLDGWMSAAIIKHWFYEINKTKPTNNSIHFIGYNYGQLIPDLSEYDEVIMCDISFPVEEMLKLRSNLENNFIWIDHHISIIKDIEQYNHPDNLFKGLRDVNFAACELTWQYFFPDEPMPEIVRLLGRYDCFGHRGTHEEQEVIEFQCGARQEIWNYERAYIHLIAEIGNNVHNIEDMKENGKYIYQYLCTKAKQVYKNGFEIELGIKYIGGIDPADKNLEVITFTKGYKFICINKERFNPINFGIDYHKDGYDGCASFHYDGNKWAFSLYNDNGLIDCSLIAKQYDGSGHKGAAGFRIDNIEEFFKNHKI